MACFKQQCGWRGRFRLNSEKRMNTESDFTVQMHAKLQRMREGDRAAQDELLRSIGNRLEKLTRRMLRQNPRVRRWAETGDVMQSSMMRLLRALETVQPSSTREFFNLAAVQIRRELTDIARHFYGALGHGANLKDEHASGVEPTQDDRDLEAWSSFHQAVELLPSQEREVVSLIFYHDWSQQQAAELFQVDVRTIRRWWQSAITNLRQRCQTLPQLG
jgi:RNA polymerase sigma factor (sigma-70 family)